MNGHEEMSSEKVGIKFMLWFVKFQKKNNFVHTFIYLIILGLQKAKLKSNSTRQVQTRWKRWRITSHILTAIASNSVIKS
jgi:hypothetical protein